MTNPDLTRAITELCTILTDENAKLAKMDIPAATALVEAKRLATEQLLKAHRLGKLPSTPENLALAEQLRDLSKANQTLLERAMMAQNRIMAVIARAIPKTQHNQYGSGGVLARPPAVQPVALFSNA